MQESLVPMEQG